MKTSRLMSALMLGALTLGTAYAQDRHDGDRRDNDRHDNNRGAVVQRAEMNRHDGRVLGNRAPDRDSYYGHQWQRGERVPTEFRNRQYVVNDWRGHRLHQPPRGYQWVQVGGDYMLVAIATGIIAEMALNH